MSYNFATAFFKQLNLTDEDINYIKNFNLSDSELSEVLKIANHIDYSGPIVTDSVNINSDNQMEFESLLRTSYCYCNSAIRNLAIKYKNYHGYVSLIVCAFGIITNVLNIIVLTRKDTRTAPINRILTGLATTDVLVMLEYIPFVIYKYFVLPEKRIFLYELAVFVMFHMHFTQIFHTISIALTLTLAVWRYIAIRFPQYSHTWCTGRRCTIALFCSFLVPLLVCAPTYFLFKIKRQIVYEGGSLVILYHVDVDNSDDKRLLYRLNFWMLSVVVKLLPCVLLTIIICWLIKALYRTKGRKQILKSHNHCVVKSVASVETRDLNYNGSLENRKCEYPQRASKFDKRTDRTTRMLVVVLLLFLITEIPQGVLGLLSAILDDCFFRYCYHILGEIMDILALLNGSINFILYCSMSRQFRMIFGQLFKPKIMKKWPTSHQHHTEVQTTYV